MAARTTQDCKKALAQIVAPETLHDIEEYIRPTFPDSGQQGRNAIDSVPHVYKDRFQRRIVVDGFGRWREIRPEAYSRFLQSDILEAGALSKINSDRTLYRSLACDKEFQENASKTFPLVQQRLQNRELSYVEKRRASSSCNSQLTYDHLSTNLRSNVFPGIGNKNWASTTAKTFQEQNVTPPWKCKEFYGLQTDYFGKWSAANVHHERMKKKWDEYLSAAPKLKANWSAPNPSEMWPKKKNKEPKLDKMNMKPKAKKKELPQVPRIETPIFDEPAPPPPTKPPIDLPIDDGDDDFWNFFDQPFNRPK